LIAFLAGQNSVFMPDANNATPATISHGHSLTELSVSIKCFLNDYAHDSHIRFYDAPRLPSSFNTPQSDKPARCCSPLAGHGRGANSTRSHERHRKAPLREARQAAPDGARASAALSSSKNLRFSRGTWPLRRKDYGFAIISYIAANSIADGIFNKSRLRLQPSRESLQRKFQMRTNAGEPPARRPATIPRDENLEVNFRRRRKAQGGTEATTRSILDLSAAAIPSPVVFIADTATSRMARSANCRAAKTQRAPKSPVSEPSHNQKTGTTL
jgi:hypothetical protein